MVTAKLDTGYRSKGLFGIWKYDFTERSADVPGELFQLDSWVYQPESEQQEAYLTGESVYRDFVYENYLDISPQLKAEMERLFAPDGGLDKISASRAEGKTGIYGMTQTVRSMMERSFFYKKEPELAQSGDPLTQFLRGNQYGNSAYYASAGVLAMRSLGVPARYAEGYYADPDNIAQSRNGQILLTSQDAHAWTEIYMDGMGWIPVDFTPGFYYNTYALLRMAQLPQNVRKTAALQDEGEEAENVAGNTPQIKQQDQLSEQVRAMYVNVVTGVLLLVLFLFLLFIVVLEAGHLFYEEKIRKMVRQEEKRSTEYLCRQISGNLSVLGIEVRLGWNAAETDRSICNCMPDIEPGIYQRVNYVLEKYVYETGHLEPEEFRLLGAFLIAIRESRKLTGIRKRFLSRYIVFIRG